MEIHELNTFNGTPGAGDFFATDNGTDTSKISAEGLFAPLNARIDNIIAGGDAPSAAEVTDARLGATELGATQYASLGAAIRGQSSLLYDNENFLSELIAGNFYPFVPVYNSYVSQSDGSFLPYNGWNRTDFLEVVDPFYAYMPEGSNSYNAFYDENHTFISRFDISKTGFAFVQVPTNAKYFVCSNTAASLNTLRIYTAKKFNLNLSEIVQPRVLSGFFFRGTYNAQGEIIRGTSKTLVTDIICLSCDSHFQMKADAPIQTYIAIYDKMGGAYVGENLISATAIYTVPESTPFRIFVRKKDGTAASFNEINEYIISDLSDYAEKAKLYYFGQTPESFTHQNPTTSGYFNLIETSSGKIIVNDASHQSNNAFISNFIFDGRSHFDYFVLSHWHSDHSGLLGEMVRWGCIDENTVVFLPEDLRNDFLTVFPQETETWDFFNSYLPRLQESGASLIYPAENSRYYIDGICLEFWNTEHDKYYQLEATAKNYNDLSLCFYLTLGNVRACYPGDLGPIGQEECAASMKKCNIHEAQHHGWDNGVNNLITDYIDKLSPEVVVANDGAPHTEYFKTDASPMVTWCIDNCVPFYRCYTQNDGFVEFEITRDSWQLVNSVQRYRRPTE